jgi:hypothetical protein
MLTRARHLFRDSRQRGNLPTGGTARCSASRSQSTADGGDTAHGLHSPTCITMNCSCERSKILSAKIMLLDEELAGNLLANLVSLSRCGTRA